MSASAQENRTSPCLATDGFYPLHFALQWLSTTGLTPDGGPGARGGIPTQAHTILFFQSGPQHHSRPSSLCSNETTAGAEPF